MKQYFAYTRVSTTRQGEQGVSLQQQRASIEEFTAKAGMQICEWLEEQETAAKQGRPVFAQMLKGLRKGTVAGVVMHKIDRSARNLKDWAELGQLIDQGIEVHFSNEAVDMASRGGRLSADIQAVVAADFIRNLRDEVKKGFYGRLKQGLTPMPAPLGYVNNAAGKAKSVDPLAGPLVREAFNLYATGRYSFRTLTDEVNRMGLRTRKGMHVSVNVVARILSNTFYIGVITLRRSKQVFKGIHEPLVTPSLYRIVQDIASGKSVRGPNLYDYVFSRLLSCENCGRILTAERQKGRVYYRCHMRGCPGANIREDSIAKAMWSKIKDLHLMPDEIECIEEIISKLRTQETAFAEAEVQAARLKLTALTERHSRLTDAFLDGALDRVDFDKRKATLLMERCDLEQKLARAEAGHSESLISVEQRFELIKHASLLYENGFSTETRDLILDVVSNRTARGKTLMIAVKEPLSAVAKRPKNPTGGPISGSVRTFWHQFLH